MSHPQPFSDDFDFQGLADDYGSGQFTIDEITTKYGITRDTFFAIRKAAPHQWRKGGNNLWWSDLEGADAVDTAQEAVQKAKAKRADRKAKQRQRRQDRKAIRKWNRLERAIQEASESFRDSSYEPPKPKVQITSQPPHEAAVIANFQDLHIGKKPKNSSERYHTRYVKVLKESFAEALKSSLRRERITDLYLITGGDLIHVDNFQETTTAGTPQDTLLSPTEALQSAIGLLRWMVDYARSLGITTHIVPVTGNHDKVLGQAAGIAIGQRFYGVDQVEMLDADNRVYFTYEDHLILATHGDMYKKQFKKLPSLIMKEARELISKTKWQTVLTGHLHFQAQDLKDESGTLHLQTASPSPVDEWHDNKGFVGTRRGVQLLSIRPNSPTTTVMHKPVTVKD